MFDVDVTDFGGRAGIAVPFHLGVENLFATPLVHIMSAMPRLSPIIVYASILVHLEPASRRSGSV